MTRLVATTSQLDELSSSLRRQETSLFSSQPKYQPIPTTESPDITPDTEATDPFDNEELQIIHGSGTEATPPETPPRRRRRFRRQRNISKQSELSNSSSSNPANLGTVEGVFVPVFLSIWGLMFFIRFGFVVGETGLFGTLFLLAIGFAISTLTGLSVCAISTNGRIKAGGTYYILARTLGPEFGGSIGLVYYIGTLFAGAMSAVGFVEPLMDNFSITRGSVAKVLPEGTWFNLLYATIFLVFCTVICLNGPQVFAKTSKLLFFILNISTLSVIISLLVRSPMVDSSLNLNFTGPSLETLKSNLYPSFSESYNMNILFGILFPSCTGVLSGISLSGDLKDPGRSIPKGTMLGVGSTLFLYVIVAIVMASTVSRETLTYDLAFLQQTSLALPLLLIGLLATSLFAVLGCLIGAANILQAVSRDNLIPQIAFLSRDTEESDTPIKSILVTYFLTQLLLFIGSVNALAPLYTMTTLLTYGIVNLACFLLGISGAPNFRPSFKYFKSWTALLGLILCFVAMVIVDLNYALLSLFVEVGLFFLVHYSCDAKNWGDVSGSLIYHQVRKYLLKLDVRRENVKNWRPQILLFTNNPTASYNLIHFANNLKKGSLFILGHVVTEDFETAIHSYQSNLQQWLKFIDITGIKAFVQFDITRSHRRGLQSILLGSGLGGNFLSDLSDQGLFLTWIFTGMKPNIVMLGFYQAHRTQYFTRELPRSPKRPDALSSLLPFSETQEYPISPQDYVGFVIDTLCLTKSIAIARNFDFSGEKINNTVTPKYIDLWPLLLNSDPDTYTLILQLGYILTKTEWGCYKLRLFVLIEKAETEEFEMTKVRALLADLRIDVVALKSVVLEEEGVGGYEQGVRHNAILSKVESQSAIEDGVSESGSATSIFNSLHSHQQYEAMNHLFKKYSSIQDTAVLLTSLPAPEIGTDKSADKSAEYLKEVETLSNGVVPIVMIHARVSSVTMNL
ncbi:amino acid permease-domain-containing protein [Paraphysoderma sedebokerense]|nr:amino acid permease-domain-containing protein [Paraphysoderma sedebokerense]